MSEVCASTASEVTGLPEHRGRNAVYIYRNSIRGGERTKHEYTKLEKCQHIPKVRTGLGSKMVGSARRAGSLQALIADTQTSSRSREKGCSAHVTEG